MLDDSFFSLGPCYTMMQSFGHSLKFGLSPQDRISQHRGYFNTTDNGTESLLEL